MLIQKDVIYHSLYEEIYSIHLNGELHTKSMYLQSGKWIDGHEIYYKKSPEAPVIFK